MAQLQTSPSLPFRAFVFDFFLIFPYTPNMKPLFATMIPILRQAGVTKAGLFGSTARGEDGPNSDIDVLVSFPPRKSILDLIRLQNNLQQALHKQVDIVTYDSLYPPLRERILKEQQVIYDQGS